MAGRIQFRIDAKGDVHMDVEGVEDASCEQLTAAFEAELGGDIVEVQRKPEYYVELDGVENHQYEGEE